MASPSHFSFTLSLSGLLLLIREGIEPTTTPDPGTDRYLVHEWQVFLSSQWRLQQKSQVATKVANPETPNRPSPSHGFHLVFAAWHNQSWRCLLLSLGRVQTVASVLSTSSSSKKEGPASLVAAHCSITTSSAYMVALHQWTSSAGHSLDLACGRLSAHAKS